MATITTKFDIGDHVWPVLLQTEPLTLPCDTCQGRKYVSKSFWQGGNQRSSRAIKCHVCSGLGEQMVYWRHVWYVGSRCIVTGVSVYCTIDTNPVETYKVKDPTTKGLRFDGRSLFGTFLEAAKAADERTDTPSNELEERARKFLAERDKYTYRTAHVIAAKAIVRAAEQAAIGETR